MPDYNVFNSRKPLTMSWQSALSWPKNWIPTQIQQDRHIPTLEHININTKEKWYDHEPQTVTEKENITISLDMPIQNISWDDDDDDDHHNDHDQDDDSNDNSDSIIY